MLNKVAHTNNNKLQIASIVAFTFFGYLCIGLPLAVIPIFVHKTLGYSELTAGVVISLQYLSTFLTRGYSGKIIDNKGPKLAVLISMVGFIISGLLLYSAILLQHVPLGSLAILAVSRLLMGAAEGMVGASPINWAMLVVGRQHTAIAISYNGIASYGSLALGAPLGVWIQHHLGLEYLGIFIVGIALSGFLYANQQKAVLPKASDEKKSFLKVLKIVAPFGIALGLAGIGFGGISNFITLYYDHFHWKHAAYCLTAFSVLFVTGRFIFSNAIEKWGGLSVALLCLSVETLGLIILFVANDPQTALIGASITGVGFSLIFPALGVEAVKLTPVASSGAALAAYGLFIDISLGITGPFAGSVIKIFGMPYLFLFCGLIVFIGLLIVIYLKCKRAT